MEKKGEYINLKLHKIQGYKTPFIITAFYPIQDSTFEEVGKKAYELIQTILTSNNLSMKDVTVLYYYHVSKSNKGIYEWVFDTYSGKYIGNRLVSLPLCHEMNNAVELQELMIEIEHEELKNEGVIV